MTARRKSGAVWAAMFGVALLFAASSASAQAFRESTVATAKPGETRVFVSGAMRAPMIAVRDQVTAAIGRPLAMEVGQSRLLQQQIEAGQVFEVALITSSVVDDMIAKGFMKPGSKVELGQVLVGLAARGDTAKVDVSSNAALKKTLLGAKAIRRFYGVGASVPGVDKLLNGLGVTETLQSRMVALGTPQPVTDAQLGPGEYELIVNLASEVIPMQGWKYFGTTPAEFQVPVLIAAGIGAKGDEAPAKALIAFLKSPAFDPALKANGMTR